MGINDTYASNLGGGWIFISILLFIIGLGLLITIHELGHLMFAKIFKVYCTDFSIGFGPKIVHIKRKNAETAFNIGVLPLGGYVAMYNGDEDDELPEGVKIPPERSLRGVARWKRILIMLAGIMMNFALAFVIFFISSSCFPQTQPCIWLDVKEEALANVVLKDDTVGFGNNDYIFNHQITYQDGSWKSVSDAEKVSSKIFYLISNDSFALDGDTSGKKYVALITYQMQNINDTDISQNIFLVESDETVINEGTYYKKYPLVTDNQLTLYKNKENDSFLIPVLYAESLNRDVKFNNDTKEEDFNYRTDTEGKTIINEMSIKLKSGAESFNSLGVSFYKYEYWNGWNSFKVAGNMWLKSTTVIGESIGSLFVGKGWDQVGGPIAMYTQTTAILQNNPFYVYLNVWGMISVNLAIINLLPFPGLDGWQVLTEIVESCVNGVKKAKYNKKVKNNGVIDNEVVDSDASSTLEIGKAEVYKPWRIPKKVTLIMRIIGFILLGLFIIFIFVKDFIGLIGV